MIEQIIPVITPDNIKEITLLKDSLDIFLEYLVENSDITIDIKNILDEHKKVIYEEFVKIYLNNIYEVLTSAKHNENLFMKLSVLYESVGENIEDVDLNIDVTKLLTKDFLWTNSDYELSKGTPKGMEYIYDIILNSGIQKDIEEDNLGSVFEYSEGDHIFEYNIEGSLLPSVYEHFVKPLTHPVGWAYFYKRIFYLGFVDYFRVNFDYTIRELKVKCMNGFEREEDDYVLNVSHLKARFDNDSNYGNELTIERDRLISENLDLNSDTAEYKSNLRLINVYNRALIGDFTLVSDSTVKFINTENIGIEPKLSVRKTVHFINGEMLETIDTLDRVRLYGLNGEIILDYNKDYNGNCGLYMDYDEELTTLVTDDFKATIVMPMASTTGKLNVVGAGNVFVGSTISGDNLVNKDVSVTYRAVTGKSDGTNFSDLYTPGGRMCNLFWDSAGVVLDDNLNFDGCASFFENYDRTGIKWDSEKYLDKSPSLNGFNFDKYKYSDNELRLLNPFHKAKTLYGATSRDEYDFKQIPVHQALVEFDFSDSFLEIKEWDAGLNFGEFKFDSNRVSDSFSIETV